MGLTAEVKSRLWFSVMLVAVVAIVGEAAHQLTDMPDTNAALMAFVVSVGGLTVWIIGWLKPRLLRRAEAVTQAGEAERAYTGAFSFMKESRYMGGIFSLGGMLLGIYILIFSKDAPVKPKPAARPKPVASPVVSFPELTVTGLTLHGGNSSAVINGRVVHLGEEIEGVRVVAIDNDGVSVALGGQTNRIVFLR